MEQAHEIAREHIQTEMRRQKRYHDNKLFWEKFEKGDEVNVFFLRKHVGRSPKFTFYWHGPYVVIEKFSDLTYMVRNKATGFQKAVHIYRMKRRYKREESDDVSRGNNEVKVLTQEADSQSSNTQQEVVEESGEDLYDPEVQTQDFEEFGRGRRERRQPQRFSDYVM